MYSASNTLKRIDPLDGEIYTVWLQCLERSLDNLDLWEELMAESAAVTAPERLGMEEN